MAEAGDSSSDKKTQLNNPDKPSILNKSENENKANKEELEEELECAVCLQTCIHPVRLPCKHIFCFLCVKGVANQSKRCAMCRSEIPATYLDHPDLLNNLDLGEDDVQAGYQWFYEGRNGWWQYDERTSTELEAAHRTGNRTYEVLVAGFLYIIDFDRMIQMRRNDPSRRRRIKRDLSTIPNKGIAGIKYANQISELALEVSWVAQPPEDTVPPVTSEISVPLDEHSYTTRSISVLCPPTPTAPSNTPQTPHTPSTASSSASSPDTIETIRHLHVSPSSVYSADFRRRRAAPSSNSRESRDIAETSEDLDLDDATERLRNIVISSNSYLNYSDQVEHYRLSSDEENT